MFVETLKASTLAVKILIGVKALLAAVGVALTIIFAKKMIEKIPTSDQYPVFGRN